MQTKTRVICVNGHEYLYARSSITIAHGKSRLIEKSLGRAGTNKNSSNKMGEFIEYVKQEEVRMRVNYWDGKIEDKSFLDLIPLQKIETLRAELYRSKKEMGRLASELMEMGFVVDFVYNSNRMEGSRVPRSRIEKEVKEQKRAPGEVGNALRALMEVEKKSFKFTKKSIVRLHTILMSHEPKVIGIRKGSVVVGNSEVCPFEKIEEKLKELLKWFQEKKKTMYPPELAFEFYYRFERIHPFEDGNGRTGRLLMNRILRENKYHPMIISWKKKQAQENAFEKRIEGRKGKFFTFMKKEFVKTHEIYIEKISAALDVEKVTKVFLQPSVYYE